MPQPAADLVGITTAAEDRSSEIVFKESARPISRECPDREDMPAVADQPSHISSIVAGEIRIEPLDPQPGDSGIAN